MGTDVTVERLPVTCAEAVGSPDTVPANISVIPLGDGQKGHIVRPPGYRYSNSEGMEFMVLGYKSIGFKHAAQRAEGSRAYELFHGDRPPTSVLPLVAHMNASSRLKRIFHEINAVTPKELVIADASGLPERCRHVMDGLHFTSWREYPDLMAVIVDSNECREDILAHELMHIWLDLFEGYEDHRRYRDASDGRSVFMVLSAQSFVIDFKVHENLRQRGFSLRRYTDDIVDGLHGTAAIMDSGTPLRNKTQELVIGCLLATPWAVPELHDFTGEDWEKILRARRTFERLAPRMVRLADALARAWRTHGYATRAEMLNLVKECLNLHFAYLGQDFDLERDLLFEYDQIEYRDKFPHILPNVPPRLKYDVLRRLIRGQWPAGTTVTAKWSGGGTRLDVGFIPPHGHVRGGESVTAKNSNNLESTLPFQYDGGC